MLVLPRRHLVVLLVVEFICFACVLLDVEALLLLLGALTSFAVRLLVLGQVLLLLLMLSTRFRSETHISLRLVFAHPAHV